MPIVTPHVRENIVNSNLKRIFSDTFKTPRSPRIRKVFSSPTISTERDVNHDRNVLLKSFGLADSVWETYRVNALYDFSYEDKNLMNYEKQLAACVTEDILNSESRSVDRSQNFYVRVEVLHESAFTNKDKPTVKIYITNADEEDAIYFIGFLMSIGREEGFFEYERIRENAVILPLFFVQYADVIFLNSVINFLEGNFSCVVHPLKFSSYDLMWMLALWSYPGHNKVTFPTVLTYVPMEGVAATKYTINYKAVAKVWKRVMMPIENEISEEQVQKFLFVLEAHFYKKHSVDLSNFTLSKIETPVACVEEKSVMVLDSILLFSVMRHLTHLAQEMVK